MNEQLMPDKQEEKLKVVQGWDLSKYYPVTLPLQKPGSREVDAEDQCGELDENAIPAADELGLMEPSDDDRYIFFQLPSFLPFTKPGTVGSTKPTENTISNGPSRSVKKADHIGPSTWLEDLPPGEMGKLLVYRSGAVKLQLGGISFEAVAGSQCVFAQELVAINAASQHCCFLGDITEKAVLVPAINEFLEGGSNEQKR
ncbi:hypothetical protein KP509_19G035100 [Ceratopteris richardii]|nr:hypothetical protein KP509_19G035100 [Ceratopteris richardii]